MYHGVGFVGTTTAVLTGTSATWAFDDLDEVLRAAITRRGAVRVVVPVDRGAIKRLCKAGRLVKFNLLLVGAPIRCICVVLMMSLVN